MALTWLLLTFLMGIFGNGILGSTPSNPKSTLDTKRRSDVVDEAFLEQKDILLDMLESKLKEVRDKKKKKSERLDNNNTDGTKCESLPSNIDLKLKSNGLSALGEIDLLLKFGSSGRGTLNLDASGISNVGKARLDLAVGDGSIHVPGLNNLFVGKPFINNCDKQNETDTAAKEKPTQNLGNELLDNRRSGSNVTGDHLPNTGDGNKDDQNKTETTTINTNTTVDQITTAVDNVLDDSLATTVVVENNTVDLGNATTKP